MAWKSKAEADYFFDTRPLKGEMRAALLPVWSGHDGPGSLNIEVGAEIIPHQVHKIWGEAESLLGKNSVPSWPNFRPGTGRMEYRNENAILSSIIQEETI